MWEKYQIKINYTKEIDGLDFKNYVDIDGVFITRDNIYLFRDRGPSITKDSSDIKSIEIYVR